MQDKSNKKRRRKEGERDVWVGSKVKALYTKGGGWNRQVDSKGQSKCSQNYYCFSKWWILLLWQIPSCLISRSSHSHSKERKSYHLGRRSLLVWFQNYDVISEVFLILPLQVKTFILTACVPSPHHWRIVISPVHFILLLLSQWGKLTEGLEHKCSQVVASSIMIIKMIYDNLMTILITFTIWKVAF